MLRSSSRFLSAAAAVGTGARTAALAVRCALLALLVAAPAVAQSGDAAPIAFTAILELGPVERRGIDALAPDVTPYWYGRYRVADARIAVSYVRAPLERPSGWEAAACPGRTLRSSDDLSYYEAPGGWSILVEVASGDLPPGVTVCRFVDRFVDRHLLFENLEAVRLPGRAPVFPAVIEL